MKRLPYEKSLEDWLRQATQTQFPSPIVEDHFAIPPEQKVKRIAQSFREIMETLGLDLSDPSLTQTPERVARMYVYEIFSGLSPHTFPPISCLEDRYKYDGQTNMVFVKVSFHSFCEHHFVPMNGTACVAYLPNQKIIGLSKIPRIVRYFAARPQLQERLNAQIADCLAFILETEHVAVSISAEHFCIKARGIEDEHGYALTNVFRGEFSHNPSLRQEFFDATHRSS
jgi:GTP cyclohydrolase I